jgi:hypothetical protein
VDGPSEISREISSFRLRAAWIVAASADFLQIVAFPFFIGGAASPIDDALDLVVGVTLTALIGWHWSFVPSFIAKLVPGLDLVPTWSASMLLASRKAAPPRPIGDAAVERGARPLAGEGPHGGLERHLAGETPKAQAEREAVPGSQPAGKP